MAPRPFARNAKLRAGHAGDLSTASSFVRVRKMEGPSAKRDAWIPLEYGLESRGRGSLLNRRPQ